MKRNSRIRLMVVAGGSGGHIFPALGFCQEMEYLRVAGSLEIYFVSSRGKKSAELIPSVYHPVCLDEGRSLYRILRLLISSLRVMMKVSPDIVFGFGGYLSVPFAVMAKLLGRKVFLHEQNVVPGRANLFLAGFADKIAISFIKTKEYFIGHGKKAYVTKYPLRESLSRVFRQQALDFFKFQEGCLTILVMGGSQGAHRINDIFLKALKESKNLARYQVLHLCGKDDFAYLSREYGQLPLRSKVFAFLPDMNYAYSVADIVFSRSGASSIFEIAHFALPSVLIPYPYAGAHQVENARILSLKGAAIFLEDDKMTPALISGLLDIFLDDRIRRKTMSLKAASLFNQEERVKLSDLIFL